MQLRKICLLGLASLTLSSISGCNSINGKFRDYDVTIKQDNYGKNRRIKMEGVGDSYSMGALPIHKINATDRGGDGVFENIRVSGLEAGYPMPSLANKDSLGVVYDSVLAQNKRK